MGMKFVCAQPANIYYAWQTEVFLQSLEQHGVDLTTVDVVCVEPGNPVERALWDKLVARYPARFRFYTDQRVSRGYISSIRPNILKQHWDAHPELEREVVFYCDCDIILTKPPEWSHLESGSTWYASDCRFYISANYLVSKNYTRPSTGEVVNVYQSLCEIVGIHPSMPVNNELNSGGAQYIMKNVSADLWAKVERDSEAIYQWFVEDNRKEQPEKYHQTQCWTADMWALLWNAWLIGHEVKVVPEMKFGWAPEEIECVKKCTILHNAGVIKATSISDRLFFKSDYMDRLPYDINPADYNDRRGTKLYVDAIYRTAQNSCLV